jgi:hypothetical protein
MVSEAKMTRIIMDIKNEEKGKYLLAFLRQIDFLEIKENIPITDNQDQVKDKKSFEKTLLNAPVLTEEEIQSIENVGKEFKNWKINEF